MIRDANAYACTQDDGAIMEDAVSRASVAAVLRFSTDEYAFFFSPISFVCLVLVACFWHVPFPASFTR